MRKLTELIRLKWGRNEGATTTPTTAAAIGAEIMDAADGGGVLNAAVTDRASLQRQLSNRAIGTALGISHYTVNAYARRIEAAGLNQWPLPEGMTEEDVEAFLFPPEALMARTQARPLPNMAEVHTAVTTEKGATLLSLYETYKAEQGGRAYSYTQFKVYYRRWAKQHQVVMRFMHTAGDAVYVDFAGKTMEIVDRHTGEVTEAQIFVSCLGYSQYIFAIALPSQRIPDWLDAHCDMFAYYGGVTNTVVPDNLKSAVAKVHRYEPDVNPMYWEWAKHYDVVVLPARARKPRDKALAENAVKLVTQRVLYPLCQQVFHSIAALNTAMRPLLDALNARPFQQMPGSRRTRFLETERAVLRALPAERYEYAEWKRVKVGPDYHVCPSRADGRFYSVPFEYYGQHVNVRLGTRTVTITHTAKTGVERQIAFHPRKSYPGFTTEHQHMPVSHQAVSDWTPEKLQGWAKKTGPHVSQLLMALFTIKYRHAEQGVRSALGIRALATVYGRDRLNAACARALQHKLYSCHSVESILRNGLDRQPFPITEDGRTEEQRALARKLATHHENARGASYYR